MNILSAVKNFATRSLGVFNNTSGEFYDAYWRRFDALRDSGQVTYATAEGLSAVYACVSAISETIASLPLHLYKRTENGRERVTDHPLARVLHDAPNQRQTALEFREMMTATMLLRGNSYARIVRGNDGQVRELIPMNPDNVRVIELDNGRLGYERTLRDGTKETLVQEDVLHLRHRSDDGVIGLSPIFRSRRTIALAMAENEHGLDVFENSAKLTGVLKIAGSLDNKQRKAISESWQQYRSGMTPVLESGVDFQPVSMTLEDAEWIEARKFSVIEVCRLFRVPPVIVQSMESANYSNSVELARQFVTLSLRRHLVCWEQAISKQLLTEVGRRTMFAEHSLEGLLRGDSATRAEFYGKAINDGWMTVDEVRQFENLPKLERTV